jgi:hypothetical protein
MRHVIADPAFSERMPVVLAMTDAVEAAEASETGHIAQVWRLLAQRTVGVIIASAGVTFDVAREIEKLSEQHVRAYMDLPSAVRWLVSIRGKAE